MVKTVRSLLEKTILALILFGTSGVGLAANEPLVPASGLPKANYAQQRMPYAEAADGCASFKDFAGSKDPLVLLPFREACDQYFQCFQHLGRLWSQCGKQFAIDLQSACDRMNSHEATLDAGRLKRCYEQAATVQRDLQRPALIKAFEEAQARQRKYLETLSSDIRQLFRDTMHRDAKDADVLDAIDVMADGTSLNEYKKALLDRDADYLEVGQ